MMRQRWLAGTGVVLAVLVGASASRADEATAMKAIKKLGGSVLTVGNKPGNPVWYVELTNELAPKTTDADLKLLKEFKELRHLKIHVKKITDQGFKELREIKSLQTLFLTATKISDVGVSELTELTALRELDLSATAVTDAGLKNLKELKELRSLFLNNTRVTNAGMADL